MAAVPGTRRDRLNRFLPRSDLAPLIATERQEPLRDLNSLDFAARQALCYACPPGQIRGLQPPTCPVRSGSRRLSGPACPTACSTTVAAAVMWQSYECSKRPRYHRAPDRRYGERAGGGLLIQSSSWWPRHSRTSWLKPWARVVSASRSAQRARASLRPRGSVALSDWRAC